jgi:hypothetical protein
VLVGDHLLLRDFSAYRIIFLNVCFVTVAMVMLLNDFWPYGVIFMIMCVYYRFSCHS